MTSTATLKITSNPEKWTGVESVENLLKKAEGGVGKEIDAVQLQQVEKTKQEYNPTTQTRTIAGPLTTHEEYAAIRNKVVYAEEIRFMRDALL